MSRLISKKVLASWWSQLAEGEKTFDCRLADWNCQPGDRLRLVEVDDQTRQPTGRSLECRAGFVLKTSEIDFWPKPQVDRFGYQIISLIDIKQVRAGNWPEPGNLQKAGRDRTIKSSQRKQKVSQDGNAGQDRRTTPPAR